MKFHYLAAIAVATLALFVAPRLSACVSTDSMNTYHGDSTDLNDYGALFIDAGDPNCAEGAMNRLTAKLASHLNSGGFPGPFHNWRDGYYVALIYGAALRLGEQGWASKDLDWQLDYSPDGHPTVANTFIHKDSGVPGEGSSPCNPEVFNTCMDDFAGSAAGFAWMAAYKSRRVIPGHNSIDPDVKGKRDAAAYYIHQSMSAVCIRKTPLDENRLVDNHPGPVCDGTIDLLIAGQAQTLTVNGGVQLIHYGFGLMTSVLSAAQGYELAGGGSFPFTPSERVIAQGLYDEIARHADASGNYRTPADCLKREQNGAIVGGSPCDGSFIEGTPEPPYEPNMYQLYGPYDHYFHGVIDPSSGKYTSNTFAGSLFNTNDPSAHFGYGRLTTYRDMGGNWIPDGAPNMPVDDYDPLEGRLDVSATGLATGWTCDQDAPDKAIKVDLYTGDLWPPVYVLPAASGYANLASESFINSQCGGGMAHRFQIQLPPEAQGMAIHAFGLDYTWYGFTELHCQASPVCSYPACATATITAQPVSNPATIPQGATSTLTIGAGGTTPTIEWYTSAGSSIGSGSSITVSPTVTTTYHASVSNSCTTPFNSPDVTVSVCDTARVSWQPTSSPSVIDSGSSSTLSIGVTGTAPVTVQWYTSANAYVGSGASIVVSPTVTTTYHAEVTNACGGQISADVTVTVKTVPDITWSAPANITYGTPLSATQLNATSNVPGTFTYTPPAGTVLAAGTRSLSLSFTPTDTANYLATTAAQSIVVQKATPTGGWPAPAPITYGTPLSSTQLNAAANIPGTYVYNPPAGTILNAGTQTLSVTFTPTDSANYNVASGSISITVVKATPTITWSTPSSITYGTALGATQLNASSSVAGTFTYSPAAGTVLTVGTQTLTTNFTPTDTANYNTASGTVSIAVVKATPTITWSTPSSITYGTALGATQLNASSTVAGPFTYSPAAGTVLNAGTQTLSVTFTPTDSANYNVASGSISITVVKATPTITWSTPSSITYGTALGATQLNASSSVAGTFTYSPAAGTFLGGGDSTLSVSFSPTDSANYNATSATVTLHVNRAAQTITWATPATITNATPLSATQLNATVSVVGPAAAGAITYDVSSGTVLSAGDHTITATAAATANYDSAQRSVVLHVCGLATINWQPTTANVADGNSTTLSIDVSSPTTAHYQWYDGTTEPNGTPVGTDSATLNTGVLTNGGGPWSMIYRYWVVITNDCGQVRSSNIDVIVSTGGGMDDGG